MANYLLFGKEIHRGPITIEIDDIDLMVNASITGPSQSSTQNTELDQFGLIQHKRS